MLLSGKALLPVLLLLAACGTGGPGTPRAGSGCPAEVGGVGVPASTVDTGGRLVPVEAPTSAVVCRYGPVEDASDVSGVRVDLVGERRLTGGLDRLAADLQLAPWTGPAGKGLSLCPGPGAGAATPYLLRLTYPDGVVTVRSDDDPTGCPDTETDAHTSREGRGDVLAASFAAGTWTLPPLPDADSRCVPDRTGRAAAAGALLPAGATRLVLCRSTGRSLTRRPATPSQQAVVEDVLGDPVAVPAGRPCGPETAAVQVAAVYPAGPAVLLTYAPGCTPEVDNGSLAAQLDPEGRRRLDAVLRAVLG